MAGAGIAGRRILVTRAQSDLAALAALIEARGAQAIAFPCIEFAPPDQPLQASVARWLREPPAAIALASPQAVDRFVTLFSPREELTQLARVSVIAAAGEGTARALSTYGIAAIHPDEEAGAGPLAELLIARLRDRLHATHLGSARVLLPQAAEATRALAEKLRAAGFEVEEAALYKTTSIVKVSKMHEAALERLRAGQIDAIAFASGSAARGFFQLLGPAAIALASTARVVCIGPSSAAEARALGLEVAATGSGGFDSMLDALAACYSSAVADPEETA